VVNVGSLPGENQHLPHYLQSNLRERYNIYHIIYKAIYGRKPTFTTLFTKLFKGENQHLPLYLQSYLRERTNIYHFIYKAI
jgi:hypothetical protein